MGKSTISMAIFNSYVKLPEGILDDLGWFWKIVRWFLDTFGLMMDDFHYETDGFWLVAMIWEYLKMGNTPINGNIIAIFIENTQGEPVDFGVLYF